MKKIVIFPNDPIIAYFEKGEIKARYYNPNNFFDEVHIISLCDEEIEEEKVQKVVGDARLKIYAIGGLSLKKPWHFLRLRSMVFKLVASIKPDMLRAFNAQLQGYLAVYCGEKLGISSVLSLHTDPDESRKLTRQITLGQWLLSLVFGFLFERYSVSKVTKVICVSNFLVAFAQKHGARDIEVIYNKVYSEQFRKPANIPENRGRPRILSVGRLEYPKNQEYLLRAIKNIDAQLTLIGDGANYGKLERLAQGLGISERVYFIKSIPNEEIQRFYWDADIFAMSSFYEGFCIPVLEAMASGLPVVVNNKEPLPEILGGTGIVVENTPDAFAEALRKLLAEPELRKELGEKASQRALEIDGSIMEAKEADLYRRLLDTSN